jgi:hypothetical protein
MELNTEIVDAQYLSYSSSDNGIDLVTYRLTFPDGLEVFIEIDARCSSFGDSLKPHKLTQIAFDGVDENGDLTVFDPCTGGYSAHGIAKINRLVSDHIEHVCETMATNLIGQESVIVVEHNDNNDKQIKVIHIEFLDDYDFI